MLSVFDIEEISYRLKKVLQRGTSGFRVTSPTPTPSAHTRRARISDRARLARERHEHLLRDILRELRIPAHPPQRRGIHAVEVPPHQLRKRALVSGGDEAAEQDGIGVFRHGFCMATAELKTEQSFLPRRI